MPIGKQSLPNDHQTLYQKSDALKTLADDVGAIPVAAVARRLDDVLAFITGSLLVAAQAEDQVFYPVMARVMGAPAVKPKIDHAAIRQMTEELQKVRQTLDTSPLTREMEQALRRLLYGLHTLVHLHLEQEDEVFFPALERTLSPDALDELVAATERATHDLMEHT